MGEVNKITVNVRPGDTLESIAGKYGVTVDAIEALDPFTIGQWLVSDDFRPMQIQVPQAPNGQSLEVVKHNGIPVDVIAVNTNEITPSQSDQSTDETAPTLPNMTVSPDTPANGVTTQTQSSSSWSSVIKQFNNAVNAKIEQAMAQAEAQIEERYLESLPGLWSMQSRDDLLRYFWVKQGNSLESYNQTAAQQLVIESSWQYAHELGTQLDNFSELTPDQQQYLTMLQSINPPSLYETGQQTLLAHYQSEYAQLFGGQHMDTFFQMFSDTQGIAESGAFISPEFWDFAQAYQYVSAVEDGTQLPFVPQFLPEYATDTLLYSTFLFPEIQNFTDADIQSVLMRMMAGNLYQLQSEQFDLDRSLVPTWFSEMEIEDQLYESLAKRYGPDFTPEDVATFVNDISREMIVPDGLATPIEVSTLPTFEASQAFLQGKQIDEARQLVMDWDQEEATQLLAGLRGKVEAISNLPGEILGVSTDEVKSEFRSMLESLTSQYQTMAEFRQEAPETEQWLFNTNLSTEERLQQRDEMLFTAIAIMASTAVEPIDWAVSLKETLETGDISPLLWSVVPFITGAGASSAGRIFRSLDDLSGAMYYGRRFDDVWGYGDDAWASVANDLDFMHGYGRASDYWAEVFERWSFANGKSPIEYEDGKYFTSKLWGNQGDNVPRKYAGIHGWEAWSESNPMSGINNFEQFILKGQTGQWIDIDPRYMTSDEIKDFVRSPDGKQILIPAEIGAAYTPDGRFVFARTGYYKIDEDGWENLAIPFPYPVEMEGKIFTHYHPLDPSAPETLGFSNKDIWMTIVGSPVEMRAIEHNGSVFQYKPTSETHNTLLNLSIDQRQQLAADFDKQFGEKYNEILSNKTIHEGGGSDLIPMTLKLDDGTEVKLEFNYIVTHPEESRG